MKKICLILFAFSLVLSLVSCEKDKDVVLVVVSVSNEQVLPTYSSATISSVISSKVLISQAFVHYTISKDFASYEEVQMQEKDGQYTAELVGLQENCTYYYRYAVANRYSSLVIETVNEFSTLKPVAPVVATLSVTKVTDSSAVVGGNVTDECSSEVTECGVVYSTNPNPTTADSKVISGSGIGEFKCTITGLQKLTTYYVRAYAKNDAGTAYGEEMSFTTQREKPTIPYFSVGETMFVTFSLGNLQYTQSTNTWSFAENQWDYIGTDNVTGGWVESDPTSGDKKYYGTALADKVDLFAWSTNDNNNFGVSTSNDNNDYVGSFVDWGTNKIGNDAPNTWRTLTYNEWDYVVFDRPNASSLMGVAQVNGVNGLILLPDNWVASDGIAFKPGFHIKNGVDYYAAYQTFTAEQWTKLEAAGAVFLPAAGYRDGSDVGFVQYVGYYWSATEDLRDGAHCLSFSSIGVGGVGYGSRNDGHSVRLVKDL